MSKVTGLLSSRLFQVIVAVSTVVGVVAAETAAGAVNYMPTTALTTFASSFSTNAGTIILPVAVAMVGLVVLFWAIRFVFGFLRGHR